MIRQHLISFFSMFFFFFFNDTATTEIYTLSLHDALPISAHEEGVVGEGDLRQGEDLQDVDRKSTRLNSSHYNISYAVFCLKKKKQTHRHHTIYEVFCDVRHKHSRSSSV